MIVIFPLLILAGGSLIAVLVLARLHERRREAAYHAAAQVLGFEYLRDDAGPLTQLVNQIPILSEGRGHTFRHVVRTTLADVDAYLAEVTFYTGERKRQVRHTIAIAAFRTGFDRTPDFDLRLQNGYFNTIEGAHAQRDIDFDDDPLFSQTYTLTGPNEYAIRAFFTPDRRQHLTSLTDPPTIESHADWLVYLEPSTKPRLPQAITARFEHAFNVCEPLL